MKKVKFATSHVTPPGANIRSNMTGHVAHDWYTSLKPLSINSWQQVKAELLATFRDINWAQKPRGIF